MKKLQSHLVSLMILMIVTSCSNKQVDSDQVYQIPEEVKSLPYGTTLGLRAPEIELPNPDGEKMTLSSLRGKLVLVDFWAAWCNPCRRENPNLVKTYAKFHSASFEKGEGFEIVSVSLDRNEKDWKEAISKDNLSWPYQLGDMLGARSKPVQDYGIQMIPTNFLLDQNGVIIATNLRGEALEEKLDSLLKQK
jgi:peroxiredoxin